MMRMLSNCSQTIYSVDSESSEKYLQSTEIWFMKPVEIRWIWVDYGFISTLGARFLQGDKILASVWVFASYYLTLLRTLFMTIFGCLLFLFRFFLPWFILLNENLANIFIIATFWFSFFLTQICFLWKCPIDGIYPKSQNLDGLNGNQQFLQEKKLIPINRWYNI